MKTLVIHPKDFTTDVLREAYIDKKDCTVINEDCYISRETYEKQIREHDRIMMFGHGTPDGLIGHNFRYVINDSYADLLRGKECICVWCYADEFVKRHNLKGFYTGMIISEQAEAYLCQVETNEKELLYSNLLFGKALRKSIDTEYIVDNVRRIYRGTSPVIQYNRRNLYYN